MEKLETWWKNAVGYIIYPESFKDSNGDGIGDLNGITSKLDYLKDLGVNLLWICPIFKSPMDDNGYDVSDYYQINPEYGTNADFDNLIKQAHARGIHILIDFVLNHTSDQHAWFQKALKDPNSEERDYYFFRKGKKVGDKLLPPTNWKGFFATSAWEQVPGSDDFYMNFLKAIYDQGTITLNSGAKFKLSKAFTDAHDAFYADKVKGENAELKALNEKLAAIKGGDEELSKQIEVLKAQLAKDEAAEKQPHQVVYGIRPEDIHEVGLGDKGLGDPYEIKVAVAELLGHEYYVHSDFSGIDLVAKIPLTHEIKIGDSLKIAFTLDKGHIFDPVSEKRIY